MSRPHGVAQVGRESQREGVFLIIRTADAVQDESIRRSSAAGGSRGFSVSLKYVETERRARGGLSR
jgi:hypothetical protein